MEERISGAEDSIRNMDTTIKENANCKNILTQNIQKIQDKMRRPNLWIIGVDENEDFQLKGPANIFNIIIEENFPNPKKEMHRKMQAYRIPIRLHQKISSSCYIVIKTLNAQNKEIILIYKVQNFQNCTRDYKRQKILGRYHIHPRGP
jgi:hypothetical protein